MSEKETFWLGIDCGGTYLKAGLYDAKGHEHGINRQSLQTASPLPGYAERDMHQLWQQCVATIAGLLARTGVCGDQIKGVGISAQGKGLFLLDKQDKPLGNAILSSDRRAMDIVQRWQQDGIPEQLYPVTRQTLWTGHPASLLRWVKENQPHRYAQIGCVMMGHDYLRWCLTGVKGCEESNISESNLYNMTSGQYDSRLTQWLGISEIDNALPPIVGSAEICGEITAQTAAITGLAAGTPVVGGLFDVVSTALCAGIEDEYTLNAVMGTWPSPAGSLTVCATTRPIPMFMGAMSTTGSTSFTKPARPLPAIWNGLPPSGANSLLLRSIRPSPAYRKPVASFSSCPFCTAATPGWR